MSRCAIAAAVLGLCALLAPAGRAAAAEAKELVAKLPAQGAADGQALAAELVKLGAAGVKEVCGMLAEPAQGGDAKARFALHGMALHAARPDAEAERQMLEGALLEALGAAPGPEVKAFLLEQLKLVARDASVAPAAKLLGDDRLCEPAAQLLLVIRTPAVSRALAEALPNAKDKNLVTIVRALGVLREKSACKAILPHAASEDATLRQTAWYALANSGEPGAVEALTKAAEGKAPYERSVATRSLLLLAGRLAEAGDKAACAKICRALAAERTAPRESNVVCEALAALADGLGAEALPDLLAALDHKDLKIREGALQLLQGLQGPEVAAQLAARLKGASPESRAAIVRVLGSQRNKAALPALTAALQDEDQTVRVAALRALGGLGADALAPLAAKLGSAQAEEARAIKEVLSSMECEGFTAALGGALSQATPAAKVALLEILAARAAADQAGVVLEAAGDADAAVRLAAARTLAAVAGQKEAPRIAELLLSATDATHRAELGKALANACRKGEPNAAPALAALAKAQGEARAELLKDLAWIGGNEALQAVLADSKSEDAGGGFTGALRALGEWRDAAPASALLRLCATAKERTHQVLALRGYLRVVGLPSSRPPEQTVELLKQAFAAVKEPDDKKLVLGGLSGVRHADAAALAATCLSDDAIKEEAAAAVIRIVCPANPGEQGLRGPAVVEALEKTAKASVTPAFRKRAEDYLAGIATAGAVNLAQGKPVKTSVAHEGNNVPERAVDGNTDRDAAWFGQRWPCWLEVDLQKPEKIEAVQAFFYHDGARYYQYTLSVSTDGKEYKQVADAGKNTTPATPEGVVHKFEPVEARYVRIHILKHNANQAVHLAELKVIKELPREKK
jgi:HEAT repeat protein